MVGVGGAVRACRRRRVSPQVSLIKVAVGPVLPVPALVAAVTEGVGKHR